MKKIFTITESDRESILSLHENYKKSLVKEQATTVAPASTVSTTTERFKTATCAGLQKGPKCVDKALQVQIKINDKCPSDKLPVKLVEDGIWGKNSTKAFSACGGVISGGASSTGTTPTGVQVPAGVSNTGTVASNEPGGSKTPTPSDEPIDSMAV